MATVSRGRHRAVGRHRAETSALRGPAMLSAAAVAMGALFAPVPALAAPGAPIGVPDAGSRPAPAGAIQLPGTTVPVAGVPVTALTPATTPLLRKVEAKSAKVATLDDRLLELLDQQRIADQQAATIDTRHRAAYDALQAAKVEATAAAAAALRESAALLPDEYGSNLHGLGALSRIQRGESAGREAAARHLALAQSTYDSVEAERLTATTRAAALRAEYTEIDIARTKAAKDLAEFEREHAAQITVDEAAGNAYEENLGRQYVIGGDLDGMGADPRAVKAVLYALDQIGDMYLWAASGPNRFDCSGLMLAAYRAAGHRPVLPHYSRAQYTLTRNKTVPLNALVPGDLLFFSSSTSYLGIHHVAMYVGNGKMIEAPRAGSPVHVTTVRWSRVFAATRIFDPIDEPVTIPIPTQTAKPKPTKTRTTSPSPQPSRTTPGTGTSSPTPDPSTSTSTPAPEPSESEPSTTPSPTPVPTTPSAPPSGKEESAAPSKSVSQSVSGSASGSASRSASQSASGSASGSASRSSSGSASPSGG